MIIGWLIIIIKDIQFYEDNISIMYVGIDQPSIEAQG